MHVCDEGMTKELIRSMCVWGGGTTVILICVRVCVWGGDRDDK